ncbi:MAG: glycosyltransferase [Dermatophilaceae bacterium]
MAEAERAVAPHPRLRIVNSASLSELILQHAELPGARALLVMTSPTLLPLDGIDPALGLLESDARIATVSFLCNAAGHLSFPYRNSPNPYSVEGHDESTLTRRLRDLDPASGPAPTAVPAGPTTLVSSDAVLMVGGCDSIFDRQPEVALAELSLRCARRGLRAVLDPSTYVSRPFELDPWEDEPLQHEPTRDALEQRHGFFPTLYDSDREDQHAPISRAFSVARAKTMGLRVLIDASALGPIENGTQVQILALVDALARRDDVCWVGVGIPGAVPRYAERVLTHPKARVIVTPSLSFETADEADVLHRPFQPDRDLPWERWREVADRICVTVQDLIAYQVGAYHMKGGIWLKYRDALSDAVRRADGSIVISHDVADQMRLESLPAERDRLFVVQNGTDHLSGDEEESVPHALLERGWIARRFLVVLGADYSHKNRDLAIDVFRRLRSRGHELALLLVGVGVAQGSSRIGESRFGHDPDVLRLPDVTSEERNWLLRHAELCLYPTSAEGFGLVPFEAARFGTATVHARFGPLAEVLPDSPLTARGWDPEDLAEDAALLLTDCSLREAQIESALRSGAAYTWELTADRLVRCYRSLLAQPQR